MRDRLLDPKNDIAFKRIFGSEKNQDILIHFLNDILAFKGDQKIARVQFLNPVQDPEIASKKQSIVDVLCQDTKGVKYIIEMQVTKTKGFEKRAQYYAAKAYTGQMHEGEDYTNLKEIIFIAIADCELFSNKVHYLSRHVILDREHYTHDLKDFSFTFIELPKFLLTTPAQLKTLIEKWCYFFKYAHHITPDDLKKMVTPRHQILSKAYQELNQFNWSSAELALYERELRRVRDERAILQQKLYDAKSLGIKEGITQGITQGIQQGVRQEKITIAKKMRANKQSQAIIKEMTGLSEEELLALELTLEDT